MQILVVHSHKYPSHMPPPPFTSPQEEKAKIQRELARMTERLSKLNEELARKMQARVEFDQTIQETEAAYMKILESSSTLLGVLKRESTALKKTATSSR